MFTGIVQTIGKVSALTHKGGDIELCIAAAHLDLKTTALGDSIAVNGCCLTVTQILANAFCVDVSCETLAVTTLKSWRVDTEVNLEKALRAGDALGGHYVSGHIDGIGTVIALHDDARSLRVTFELPQALGRYVARKGSICVDGVSLTINDVNDLPGATRFEVNLIPHTREHTVMKHYAVDSQVNIEIDIIARYMERLSVASSNG